MPTGVTTEAVSHDQVRETPRPPQQGLLGPRLCLRAPPKPGPLFWVPQVPTHPPSSAPKDRGQEACPAIFPLKMRLESRLFRLFRKTRSILWVHLGSSFLPTKCHTEDGDTGGRPSPHSTHRHWHLCGPWCPKALSRPEVVEPGWAPCSSWTWRRTRPGPSGLHFPHPSPVLSNGPQPLPRHTPADARGARPTRSRRPPEGWELHAARPAVPLRTGLGHRLRGPGPVLPSGRHPERAQREDVEGHCRRPGGRPLALGQLHQPPQVMGGGLGGAGWAGGRGQRRLARLVPGGREPGRPTSSTAVGPPLLGRDPAGPKGKSRAREVGRRSSGRPGRPSTWGLGPA